MCTSDCQRVACRRIGGRRRMRADARTSECGHVPEFGRPRPAMRTATTGMRSDASSYVHQRHPCLVSRYRLRASGAVVRVDPHGGGRRAAVVTRAVTHAHVRSTAVACARHECTCSTRRWCGRTRVCVHDAWAVSAQTVRERRGGRACRRACAREGEGHTHDNEETVRGPCSSRVSAAAAAAAVAYHRRCIGCLVCGRRSEGGEERQRRCA